MKKSILNATLLAAALLATPLVAHAIPVTWTLSGVTFTGGGTASGSFDFDADLGSYSNVALTTTAGGSFGDSSYANAAYGLSATYLSSNTGCGSACQLTLSLTFASELTNAGGTSSLSADSNEFYYLDDGDELFDARQRFIDAGEVSAPVAAVPEPETYALMLAGLAAVGFTAKRRKLG